MESYDPRIDAVIAKAAPFAQPILTHLRELVHTACPEVQETIKWSMPFFDYKGTMCQMASFKQHAVFGFWKGALLTDPAEKLIRGTGESAAMGHFGKITSLADLPSDKIIISYIKEAMRLNDDGIMVAKPKAGSKPELPVPADLAKVLKGSAAAKKTWDAFAPSHRKEYIQWITEAKTDATRQKRLTTTLEWLLEGKNRMWKYQK